MHPLDNPVWHALTGPHATVAQGDELARRYDPALAAFAGLPDNLTPDAWAALHELLGPAATAVLFRSIEPPDGWHVTARMRTHQMIAGDARPSPGAGAVLGAGDVSDVLTLITQTRPGPFFERTIELGTYLGTRVGGALVAMVGERMRLPGYTEISAVCTAPEHRGRGLAAALVDTLADRIRARGDVPILHVLVANTAAIALYEKLGFTVRATFEVTIVQSPQ
jgi:ribosomal protein S18 acetylase RimI-like enzyme